MAYDIFSYYYDDLMSDDAKYSERTGHICKLFKQFDRMPSLLLDLGCGTGGFTLEFAKNGVDVIGVDPSEGMLSVAREKAANVGKEILLLCQSGQNLDLYGTVDGVVSCLDTVNHISDENELLKCFKKVSLFLEKERLFIFDVNTEYKQKVVLADNVFVLESDNVYCVWRNNYDDKKCITNINLDFFEKDGEKYTRYNENFNERAYSDTQLRKLLEKSGFKVEGVFDDEDLSVPKETSQRLIYVARKVK